MVALFKFNYFNIVRRLLTCEVACCGCFISGYKDLPLAPVATLSRRWIVPHGAFMTVSYYNVQVVLSFQSDVSLIGLLWTLI